MKNWKQSVFFGMVAIIVLIFGFIGCDDGDGKDEQPKFREATINLFEGETITSIQNPDRVGEPYTAKVQGTLLEAEWNGVADKIENAINNAYDNASRWDKPYIPEAFSQSGGVIIELEKTQEYENYKMVNDVGNTLYLTNKLYLNIKVLNNPDLQTLITDAILVMVTSEPTEKFQQ
jgi:hypothetical protein